MNITELLSKREFHLDDLFSILHNMDVNLKDTSVIDLRKCSHEELIPSLIEFDKDEVDHTFNIEVSYGRIIKNRYNHRLDKMYHREGGPAKIEFEGSFSDEIAHRVKEEYFYNSVHYNPDGPFKTEWIMNDKDDYVLDETSEHSDLGLICTKFYNLDIGTVRSESYSTSCSGDLHRVNGPALIEYDENGKVLKKKYYINGKLYNMLGPVIVDNESNETYFSGDSTSDTVETPEKFLKKAEEYTTSKELYRLQLKYI